mmetsp:Transcript_26517/g.40493  ORF Transcript_26517/g.40493 Transcript_26517/m.40493 type:complete len:134 (+) Transcript_26517:1306-1707(+)
MEAKLQLSMIGTHSLRSLPDLFSDMFKMQNCDESFKSRRNITFEYHDGEKVSVLVSNNEKKVRVQANSFHQMWMVVRELSFRLEEFYRGSDIFEIVTFDSQLPLPELFSVMDEHFAIRKEKAELRKKLEQRTI